jgi:hypothetical protein
MPFFSRILIHLVGLRSGIGQRALRQRRPGALLQLMPQFQQMATATTQLACQSGGRSTLDDAAYDQEELRGGTMGTVQRRVGPGIENPATTPAAVIEDGGPMTAMNEQAVASTTRGTGQSCRVNRLDEKVIARLFIEKIDQREIRGGTSSMKP